MTYTGFAQRLAKRNLSEKTCEKYKIYKDGDVLRMYYHDANGSPIGAKVRTKNKVFSYEGESNGLFSVSTCTSNQVEKDCCHH